jgi:crotonobetainyl-CoA:carnitine CoA-transferase CaiB-like acyl-CoA transferase
MSADADTSPLLAGLRVVSLALNLPGPAALRRLRELGATCLKLEPPSGDPMRGYGAGFFAWLHEDIRTETVDLKSAAGQTRLHAALANADVLITSSRPAALSRLNIHAERLKRDFPGLGWVEIVGDHAPHDNEAGHDLTYQAQAGLIRDQLPTTLLADMGGALLAVQAALELVIRRGGHRRVALAEAARYLGLPQTWGLTTPGAVLGGGHPGYQVLRCRDGWVALAALEPHFQAALAEAVQANTAANNTITSAAEWCAACDAATLNQTAQRLDLPLLAWVA